MFTCFDFIFKLNYFIEPHDQICSTTACTKEKICLTPACIYAASEIIQRMDGTVNPCDDFYKFACGSFIKETKIPDDKTEVNIESLIQDKLQEQLKNILSESIEENEPFNLAKKFYEACMNKSKI